MPRILLIVYTILIGTLSLLPSKDAEKLILFRHMDLFAHFCMYFGLAYLLRANLQQKPPATTPVPSLKLLRIFRSGSVFPSSTHLSVIIAGGLGASLEIAQGLISQLGREFSILDLLGNTIGALSGTLGYSYIQPVLCRIPFIRRYS